MLTVLISSRMHSLAQLKPDEPGHEPKHRRRRLLRQLHARAMRSRGRSAGVHRAIEQRERLEPGLGQRTELAAGLAGQ